MSNPEHWAAAGMRSFQELGLKKSEAYQISSIPVRMCFKWMPCSGLGMLWVTSTVCLWSQWSGFSWSLTAGRWKQISIQTLSAARTLRPEKGEGSYTSQEPTCSVPWSDFEGNLFFCQSLPSPSVLPKHLMEKEEHKLDSKYNELPPFVWNYSDGWELAVCGYEIWPLPFKLSAVPKDKLCFPVS